MQLADLRAQVVLTVLVSSGLRIGSLLGLRLKHVELDVEEEGNPSKIRVPPSFFLGKPRDSELPIKSGCDLTLGS